MVDTTTTKAVLTKLMGQGPTRRHFSEWRAKEQEKAIQACGLTYRHYRNKPARIRVLQELWDFDIPVNPVAVKQQLRNHNVPVAERGKPQKFALLLLNKLKGVATSPTNSQPKTIVGPTVEALTKLGRQQMEASMFTESDACSAELDALWIPRRKVPFTCPRTTYNIFNSMCTRT